MHANDILYRNSQDKIWAKTKSALHSPRTTVIIRGKGHLRRPVLETWGCLSVFQDLVRDRRSRHSLWRLLREGSVCQQLRSSVTPYKMFTSQRCRRRHDNLARSLEHRCSVSSLYTLFIYIGFGVYHLC